MNRSWAPYEPERSRRPLVLVGWAVVVGAAVGLFLAASIYFFIGAREGARLSDVLTQQTIFFGLWGALAVPLSWALAKLDNVQSRVVRAGCIAALGVVVWLVHGTLVFIGSPLYSTTARTWGQLVPTVLAFGYIEWIVYGAVLSGMAALRHRSRARAHERRAASLALQLANARLRTLESRLHPHFLFNALHTVGMLARAGDMPRTVAVTGRLGALLRAMLDESESAETTLREELNLLGLYLDIEKIRFGDRLDVVVDAEPGTDNALVPRFVLQPLVENAMRHGMAHRTAPGRITVRARRDAQSLVMMVLDDGPGFGNGAAPLPAVRQKGLGIPITRERLDGMYGDSAGFSLVTKDDGAVATVTVPWHTTAEPPRHA